MNPSKVSRVDGFNAYFFETNQKLIGKDIYSTVKSYFNSELPLHELNKMLIVLIPMVEKPFVLSQLRSINLCNTMYKVLTKMIINCLKPLTNKLVGAT